MARSLHSRVLVIKGDIESHAVSAAAADAMNREMLDATQRYIGSDLRMSHFAGPGVQFGVRSTPGEARVVLGGATYALADKGRKGGRGRLHSKGRKRKGQRRKPLATPEGARNSVRQSKWAGFDITDRHAAVALHKGIEAALAEVERQVSASGR